MKAKIEHHEKELNEDYDESSHEFVIATVMEYHESLSALEQLMAEDDNNNNCEASKKKCNDEMLQKKNDDSKNIYDMEKTVRPTCLVSQSSVTRGGFSPPTHVGRVGSFSVGGRQQQQRQQDNKSDDIQLEKANMGRVGSFSVAGIGQREQQQEQEQEQQPQQQQRHDASIQPQCQREDEFDDASGLTFMTSHDFSMAFDSKSKSVVEYCVEATKVEDTPVASAKPLEWWTPQKIGCLVFGSLALLAIILSVVLTQVRSTLFMDAPTLSPTLSPDARWDKVTELIADKMGQSKNGMISSFEAFLEENPSSAIYRALYWIALEDDYRVRVDDVQHLWQRYALAVLYFATGGDTTWDDSFEFMTPEHECTWSGALLCDSSYANDDDYNYYVTSTNNSSTGNIVTGINLRENNLVGQIPCELSFLTELQSLVLDDNALSGYLPTCLCELTALKRLDVYGNGISGAIPTEYSTLVRLESLSLGRNSLTGTIPQELGESLASLTHLSLERNKLTGRIPDSLWALSRLEHFNIERQSLTGTISPIIGNWTNVTLFHVNKLNGITGGIPSEMGLLTQLTSLKTSQNHMRGTLPTELGNLQNLVMLALSRNGYKGSVPQELRHLTNLKELYLQNTWLTGDMGFVCDAIETGDMGSLLVVNADMVEVNCTCCTCCLY